MRGSRSECCWRTGEGGGTKVLVTRGGGSSSGTENEIVDLLYSRSAFCSSSHSMRRQAGRRVGSI